MSEGSKDTPIITPERRINGPYLQAVLNPDRTQFREMLKSSRRTILDIGCMGKNNPRCSWGLRQGDLWVGCDPLINTNVVHKGLSIDSGAQLAVFSSEAGDIPEFHPDFISAVAPNPSGIVDGDIFNDRLKRFMDGRKKQIFMVVLDTRTREAEADLKKAKVAISDWMKKNRFEQDETMRPGNFSPNSDNLGGSNVVGCWVRNG